MSAPALPALHRCRVDNYAAEPQNISGLISIGKETESSGLRPERQMFLQRARYRRRRGQRENSEAKPAKRILAEFEIPVRAEKI